MTKISRVTKLSWLSLQLPSICLCFYFAAKVFAAVREDGKYWIFCPREWEPAAKAAAGAHGRESILRESAKNSFEPL